jgi:pyruvate dehydrogenase E2 component (dihydrolipoamide acetyltransferase)
MGKVIVMPALGMAQETGTLLRWLKNPGDSVSKGEMLMEVETDKAMVEIEAPASGILADVTAQPGDVVPVGQVIARIVSEEEARKEQAQATAAVGGEGAAGGEGDVPTERLYTKTAMPRISPVAARLAAENGIDVSQIKTAKGVIQKEDVLAYLASHPSPPTPLPLGEGGKNGGEGGENRKVLASPKARRLAMERGVELAQVMGSGPDGAVLAEDVLSFQAPTVAVSAVEGAAHTARGKEIEGDTVERVPNVWRVMVERLTHAWQTIPHFYLTRDVNATRLMTWREASKARIEKLTYTDLLVKLTAAALEKNPRINCSWENNQLLQHHNINIGLAVAIEQGLTVPVIHNANKLSLHQITEQRLALVERAHAGKLSLTEISGGTFTISNLGMYGVDAFNAIVNPPQAAILAVSRITERVVPVNHQPSVEPMMTLTLSCDHRVIDGARGAQFLEMLAELVEEPLQLLD